MECGHGDKKKDGIPFQWKAVKFHRLPARFGIFVSLFKVSNKKAYILLELAKKYGATYLFYFKGL